MNASTRNYTRASGLIFFVVSAIHAWRVISGTTVMIGDWYLPIAASWIACIAAAVLAAWGWRAR
ncbi:MAG: hypothetical protein QM719_02720 [Thermomonas sp.]|jgi:hypothetical protein